MQRNNLSPKTARQKATRIGRGSTRGKTSGRGHKGQNAHGGHGKRPEERDMIKKLPKLRGHGINRGRTVNPNKERPVTVTLATLSRKFEAGDTVSPASLVATNTVARHNGRVPKVKVVATGQIDKKLIVSGCAFTEGAKSAIEAAGGTVSE